MRLALRPAAEVDLMQIFDWYETQREGLGAEFIEQVSIALDAILENPERFAVVHRYVRRSLVKRFPYCIFFIYKSSEISIIGIFHASRDPNLWKSR